MPIIKGPGSEGRPPATEAASESAAQSEGQGAAEEQGAAEGQSATEEQGAGPGDDISGEQSWRNLLELDAQLFDHKKIRLLTPEARVLINLRINGSMSVTAAMQLAGVSYRGFYAVLERLKQAGLVGQVTDSEDHRVRNLSLDPSTPIPPAKL